MNPEAANKPALSSNFTCAAG